MGFCNKNYIGLRQYFLFLFIFLSIVCNSQVFATYEVLEHEPIDFVGIQKQGRILLLRDSVYSISILNNFQLSRIASHELQLIRNSLLVEVCLLSQ